MQFFHDFLDMFSEVSAWQITRAVYIAMAVISIFGIIRMVTHSD